MVVAYGFGIVMFFIPWSVFAVTADELRELAGVADQKERQRQQRLKTDDLGQLLPQKKQAAVIQTGLSVGSTRDALSQDPPLLSKHSVSPATKSIRSVQVKAQVMKHGGQMITPAVFERENRRGVYIAPPRDERQSALVTDAVVHKRIKFGIPMGTMLSGTLVRDINNIEPGLVELKVTSPIQGKRRELVSNTRLFADKRFNAGSGRLEINVVKGITPDALEFEIEGLVFNSQQISGLSGIISENKYAEAADTGMKRGMMAAGREAVNVLSGNSVAGRVVGATAESVIRSSEDDLQEKLRQTKHIIHVVAQPVLIRIEATF